jgi:hypothetical protein
MGELLMPSSKNTATKIEQWQSVRDIDYTEDNATPEDIQAIRATLYMFEPNIVYWYEMPRQREFTVNILRQRLTELVSKLNHYVMIIDLTRAHKPSAETRVHLKSMFQDTNLRYSVVFTEKNFLLNMAARFVLSSVFADDDRFAVIKDKDDALEMARKKFEEC